MAYIVIQPKNRHRLEGKYRVVYDEDWRRYLRGEADSYPYTAYNTEDEAIRACDAANKRG